MKKIAKIFTSRIFVVGVAVILQLFWLYMILYRASIANAYVNVFFHVISVAVALYIMNGRGNPAYKTAWVFFILLVPLLGFVMYFTMGRPNLIFFARKKMEKINAGIEPLMEADREVQTGLAAMDGDLGKLSHYLEHYGHFPAYKNEGAVYYRSGEELFPDLLAELKKAEKYIFIEFFIFNYGEMFDALIDVLKEKASAGVDVRILYDDVGSINLRQKTLQKELEQYHIRIRPFNKIVPFVSIIMNNRDHRKIVVIDGKTAFTGGINIADEYINKIERFGYWKDTGIRIRGEACWNFTCMFLEMWNYITGDDEDIRKFQAPNENTLSAAAKPAKLPEGEQSGFVQPYADSPLDGEYVGENVYLNIIQSAKRYVYIFTPYLIIDHVMQRVLINAVKNGIDVRIVTPGIPDKKMIYAVTQSNYNALVEEGVRIYQYTPGFIHAKCMVSDDKVAVVGSINMDYRSFYLHFECASVLYGCQAVMQVKEDALRTVSESKEVTIDTCRNRNPALKLLQMILYLFSPLL